MICFSRHIVSPAPTTERLQSIQRMVADQLGDALPPDFGRRAAVHPGLKPAGSIRSPTSGTSTPTRHARSVAHPHRAVRARDRRGGSPGRVHRGSPDGIGFVCCAPAHAPSPLGRAVLALLITLTGQPTAEAGVDGAQLAADFASTAARPGQHHGDCTRRLSDTALVKLFRLLRLARRLLDLKPAPRRPDVSEGGRMSGIASAQPGRDCPGAV